MVESDIFRTNTDNQRSGTENIIRSEITQFPTESFSKLSAMSEMDAKNKSLISTKENPFANSLEALEVQIRDCIPLLGGVSEKVRLMFSCLCSIAVLLLFCRHLRISNGQSNN